MPTYSISGSVGKSGAGATVFLTLNITGGGADGYAGLWPEQAETVADSSGNYSFTGLTANPYGYLGDGATNGNVVAYRVTPVLWGVEFSPFSSDQIITAANIVGINFTKSRVYALVQEYAANFAGSQNPLTNWTQVSDDPTGLQSVSGQCQALGDVASSTSPSGAYPSSYVPSSPDCYIKVAIGALNDADILDAEIRTDTSASSLGFGVEYYGAAGTANDGGLQILDIAANSPVITGLGFLNGIFPHTWQLGDSIILLARGANIYAFLNPAAAPSTFVPLGGGSSANSPAVGFTAVQFDTATTDHTTSSLSAMSAGKINSAAFSAGGNGSDTFAGYGTDISATTEVSSNPAGEVNSHHTAIIGTNRGSRFIG